jgi:hypothetical protein
MHGGPANWTIPLPNQDQEFTLPDFGRLTLTAKVYVRCEKAHRSAHPKTRLSLIQA